MVITHSMGHSVQRYSCYTLPGGERNVETIRLCAVTSCLAERGAEEAVRTIAGLGYAAVEFLVTSTLMPQEASTQRRRDLRALCTDLGVAVAGTNGVLPAMGYRILVDDRQERRRGIDQLKRVIDLCADVGGKVVTVGSVGARNIPDGMPRDIWQPRAIAAFREWGEHADTRDIRVTLEVVNRYEANWGRTIAEGLAFLDAAAHPNLGLTPDTFHMNIEEGPFDAAILSGGRRILHMHAADSNRQAPGNGNLDFVPVVKALRSIRYTGYLSLELFNNWMGVLLQHTPDEALRLGRDTLARILAHAYGSG